MLALCSRNTAKAYKNTTLFSINDNITKKSALKCTFSTQNLQYSSAIRLMRRN